MSHLLTTFFWSSSSFSGSGQNAFGPFRVGLVNKLFKLQTRGGINFQGAVLNSSGVTANFLSWGVCIVPHGTSPPDVITSFDSDTWIARRQTGLDDTLVGWAPDTSNGAVLGGFGITDDWAGQLSYGHNDQDLYFCVKALVGSLANANTFGTCRLWWI